MTRSLGALLNVVAILMLALAASCDDSGPEGPEPIAGEKPGHVRYIIHLEGDGPDLSAYQKARQEGNPTDEIEEELRSQARAKARKIRRKLKTIQAKVVETWYLTHAFTVELPQASVPTLKALDGIERIEPDVLYTEPGSQAPSASEQ